MAKQGKIPSCFIKTAVVINKAGINDKVRNSWHYTPAFLISIENFFK
jgi:hypothetical protein